MPLEPQFLMQICLFDGGSCTIFVGKVPMQSINVSVRTVFTATTTAS